jgi:tRNA (guanine37-N1)-methyltransferase
MALRKTLRNRPDLLENMPISDEDREILDELRYLEENPEE